MLQWAHRKMHAQLAYFEASLRKRGALPVRHAEGESIRGARFKRLRESTCDVFPAVGPGGTRRHEARNGHALIRRNHRNRSLRQVSAARALNVKCIGGVFRTPGAQPTWHQIPLACGGGQGGERFKTAVHDLLPCHRNGPCAQEHKWQQMGGIKE